MALALCEGGVFARENIVTATSAAFRADLLLLDLGRVLLVSKLAESVSNGNWSGYLVT